MVKIPDSERNVIYLSIRALIDELDNRQQNVVEAVWLVQTYFYQNIKDPDWNEVNQAKEKTKGLEKSLDNMGNLYKQSIELLSNLKEMLSKENEFSQTLFDNALKKTTEFETKAQSLWDECIDIRHEMRDRILESGVDR